MKENFKNKRQTASAKKADSAMDVVKVRQKVESKRRGEGPHLRFAVHESHRVIVENARGFFSPARSAADETRGKRHG